MKFLLIAIVALGLIFAIKPLREKFSFITAPVINKVGPKVENIRGGPKRWATKNELNILLRKVAEQYNETKKLPSSSGFTIWIKTQTRGGNKGVDAWGSNYYLIHEQGRVILGSRGPDKLRNTPDDIKVTAPVNN